MCLQKRGETHGSVNQAGTLPAPFPVGRRPRWLGSEGHSQRLPCAPSESSRVGGAGVWAVGPDCIYPSTDTEQWQGAGHSHAHPVTLIPQGQCLLFICLCVLHTFTVI